MTFLHYVAERLMGPPRSRSAGRCVWRCPACGDETAFSILPPKADCKDRFKCHCCGVWGDEFDLLIHFGMANYSQRRQRLEAWKQDYDREAPFEPVDQHSLSRGTGSTGTNGYDRDPKQDEFCDESNAALNELLNDLPESMQETALGFAQRALELCAKFGLHPLGLAGRCRAEIGLRESLRVHAADCDDPECGNDCRALRGLPPLTEQDRNEFRQQRERAEQQLMESVRRSMRPVLIRKHSTNGRH